ncbi:hypothetical protein AHF37_02414 [Paragonimus kellicotti]|nr:hypothetical protein AHF37_02414 [Paragonimus kellicotti]
MAYSGFAKPSYVSCCFLSMTKLQPNAPTMLLNSHRPSSRRLRS